MTNIKTNSPKLAKKLNFFKSAGSFAMLVKATALEAKGKRIIHLESGQPDFPTPKHIVSAAVDAMHDGKTKYTPPLGILPLRTAIANNLSKKFQVKVEANNIAITPSGKTAIFAALSAVIEPGDEIIYPNPGFPVYETMIQYLGGKPMPVPITSKNNFSFDMEIFRKKFSSKTKLIILNSPSNPTGGIIPKSDLQIIARMVRDSKCWVMTDEIYDNIVYDDNYQSFYSLDHVRDRTFLVNGFSKTYSMTGWRIGYLAAPNGIMEKMDYLLTHIVGCTASFTQYAAMTAIEGSMSEPNHMVKEFKRRRDYFVGALNEIPGIHCSLPQGAFYAWPNIKSFKKSSSWMADYLLKEAGVATLPGSDFGKWGEGYLRLSFATSMENLEQAIKLIKKALAKI